MRESVKRIGGGKLSQAEDQNFPPSKALSSDYNSYTPACNIGWLKMFDPKKLEHPRALMEAALRLKSANVHQPKLPNLLHALSPAQSLTKKTYTKCPKVQNLGRHGGERSDQISISLSKND